jgi:hypothetical protein
LGKEKSLSNFFEKSFKVALPFTRNEKRRGTIKAQSGKEKNLSNFFEKSFKVALRFTRNEKRCDTIKAQ